MTARTGRLRFLFAMFQGGGNIPLIMPIVAELAARGHEVRVLAGGGIRPGRIPVSEDFLRRIKDSGAEYVPLSEPDTSPFDSAPPLCSVAFGWLPPRLRRLAAAEARTTLWSSYWAAGVSAQLLERPTDVLVSDFWLFGAIAAGEAAGVPSAVIVHNAFPANVPDQPPKGFGFLPAAGPAEHLRLSFWRWAYERAWALNGAPFLNAARVDLGLGPLRTPLQQYSRADRILVLGSSQFDFPSRRLPSNVRYVGTPIDDASAVQEAWDPPFAVDDTKPIVLISLSTLSQGQGPVLGRVLKAIDGMPVHALVTLGPSLDKEQYVVPSNAVFETFIPHSAVLPHVDAMVTQCGLGSMTKALVHGVPLVCIPLVGDQPDNAARVAACGAGIKMDGMASAEEIRLALRRVLAEPHFRQAARAIGTKISEIPAEETAAAELEALAVRPARE